jgi:Clostripain family.
MKFKYLVGILFCSFCILLLSCNEEDDLINEVDRTLIFYMIADNDLATEAYKDIEDIRKNTITSPRVNIIIFIDYAFEEPKIIKIINNTIETVRLYSEFNSADGDEMNKVLTHIINLFPAKKYELVLWSHGTSWLPSERLLKSFGIDEGKGMDISSLASSLPIKFDYILFDACLMGAIEVAYELRHLTNYIIASSSEVLKNGFPYHLIMQYFCDSPVDMKKIAETYYDYYNQQSGIFRSATISLIDTSELEALAAEIKKLLTENSMDFSSFDRASVQRLDVYEEQYHFDLSDFFNKAFPDVDKSAFEEQLKKTVLYKANTPQFLEMYDIKAYCGLSCYIPTNNRPDLNRCYSGLGWSIDSGMNNVIN